MMLFLLAACKPAPLNAQQRAAVLATAGYMAARPMRDVVEGNTAQVGDQLTIDADFDDDIATGNVSGDLVWAGDPAGACSCSNDCTSSEADLTLHGVLALLQGPWDDSLTMSQDGHVQGQPEADFADQEVVFDLSGHESTAPEVLSCDEWDNFAGATWGGTVAIGDAGSLLVVIELGWDYGSNVYSVTVDGVTTAWTEATST